MAYRRARYPPVSGEPVSGKPAWPGENAGVGQPPELRSPDAVPGVTVLLRDRRQRQVTGDAELRLPVFSVTKMFLATAALRLCETGHLSLDEQVRQRVPQAPASITVREVLGHTAGLPDYAMALSYTAAVAARPLEPGGLTEILAAGRAGIQPRRGDFGYSNTGYWLLGAVLEDAAGTSLSEILNATVFGPAAMASTSCPQVGAGVTVDGHDARWAGPAGAAWSTAADLDRFLAALFSGSLVSGRSLAAMTAATPVEPHPPWRRPQYGLGMMHDQDFGTFGHGGDGPGYSIAAFTAPRSGRTAIVLARTSAGVSPVEIVTGWLVA